MIIKSPTVVNPETIEAIEDFLTAPAPTEEQPTGVNLSALQAQIRAKLRQIARDAYQAYLDYGEWPLPSDALGPAINQARTFLDRGEPRAALLVLEAATIAWIEGCRRLDQDLLEDIANEENLLDFAEVWTEALLSADLKPARVGKRGVQGGGAPMAGGVGGVPP
jgi:hypothetical protein